MLGDMHQNQSCRVSSHFASALKRTLRRILFRFGQTKKRAADLILIAARSVNQYVAVYGDVHTENVKTFLIRWGKHAFEPSQPCTNCVKIGEHIERATGVISYERCKGWIIRSLLKHGSAASDDIVRAIWRGNGIPQHVSDVRVSNYDCCTNFFSSPQNAHSGGLGRNHEAGQIVCRKSRLKTHASVRTRHGR